MKFNTWCPLFPGFYNTVFEYTNESEDIDHYNEEHGTNLEYSDFRWDIKEYEERVGKAFVTRIESELKKYIPITIEFQGISSPKEYNFTNDSINISVDIDIDKLIELIKERESDARQYFKSAYTSRSGFVSFHSNDFTDWVNKEYILEIPEHRIGALLDCLCNNEIDTDNTIYWADSETEYMNYSPID